LALYCSFTSSVGVKFTQSSSQWEARANTEEMSQTLRTNKSKETWTKYNPLTLLSQRKLAFFNREEYTSCVLKLKKSLDHQKNLKAACFPYLGLELTMHVIKNQIHPVRQSL
jgi:hypothetical protein